MEIEDVGREADRLKARITAKEREEDRRWALPCACPCGCRAQHRFNEVCALCRAGDCWGDLDAYLAKIETRRSE